MLRRKNERLVRWTSPLWSSLLLAGCDAMPRTPGESAALPCAIEARLPANSALRPCIDPALMAPGANHEVLATSHPVELEVERLPAIPRPFPATDPGVPLAVTLPQQSTPRVTRLQPTPSAINGPSLFSPAGRGVEAGPNSAPAPRSTAQKEIAEEPGGGEVDPLFPAPPILMGPSAAGPRAESVKKPADMPAAQAPPKVIKSTPLRSTPAPARPEQRLGASPVPAVPRTLPSSAAQGPAAPLAAPARSREIEAVARQAERQVKQGFDLAARGALYSARSQFIQALRTIAQAHDVRSGDRRRSEALSAGLGALDEAEDFVPRGSRLEADLDLATLVRGHRTPVLKDAPADELAAVTAQQRYYAYAHEQLTLAAGGEESGSMALFGLGKTYGTLAQQGSSQVVAAEAKAMVYHQAAVTTTPGNFLAANELAVLAARYGRYETARSLLQHSVALAPQADLWRNLAAVHRRLGERELAELAEKEAVAAARRDAAGQTPPSLASQGDVQWVDAKTFAASSRPAADLQKPASVEREGNAEAAASAGAVRSAPWSRQTSQPESSSAARR